jgi:hypothetical protein
MNKHLPQFLLAASAAILALSGVMHARVFAKAEAAVNSSNLPEFYANSFKALWLIDSSGLLILAFVFAFAIARPRFISGKILLMLALIPATTAVFQYVFLGMFLPAHLLSIAAVTAALAGVARAND